MITLDSITYQEILKVLNHIYNYGVNNDDDNEIDNIVFVLLTEKLKK